MSFEAGDRIPITHSTVNVCCERCKEKLHICMGVPGESPMLGSTVVTNTAGGSSVGRLATPSRQDTAQLVSLGTPPPMLQKEDVTQSSCQSVDLVRLSEPSQ